MNIKEAAQLIAQTHSDYEQRLTKLSKTFGPKGAQRMIFADCAYIHIDHALQGLKDAVSAFSATIEEVFKDGDIDVREAVLVNYIEALHTHVCDQTRKGERNLVSRLQLGIEMTRELAFMDTPQS